MRAGQRATLKERFRFRFVCPLQWKELQVQGQSLMDLNPERHCQRCNKTVYRVKSLEELRSRALQGDCVAVRATEIDGHLDFLTDETLRTGSTLEPSCLVGEDAPEEEARFTVGDIALVPDAPVKETILMGDIAPMPLPSSIPTKLFAS